jgi:hypothetical protein
MSGTLTALRVAVGLMIASGCALLAIEYAPLPNSWDAFLLSVAVLAVVFWVTLLLGAALLLCVAVAAVAHRFARTS